MPPSPTFSFTFSVKESRKLFYWANPVAGCSPTTGRAGTKGKRGSRAMVSWHWCEKMQSCYYFTTTANNAKHGCYPNRNTIFLVKIFPAYNSKICPCPSHLITFNSEACVLSVYISSSLPGIQIQKMWFSHTLITGTRGLNLEDSCVSTSPSSCWCFRTFLIFMILTIAACTAKSGRHI